MEDSASQNNSRFWSDTLVVIPARLRSSRLPGKPLIDLNGKPMIVRTAERCLEVVSRDQLVVATDSEEIANVCKKNNLWVEMTDERHLTGTDRVAEISKNFDAKRYLNVQGDEPLFNPADIVKVLRTGQKTSSTLTGYCKLEPHMWGDPKHIKLVFGMQNQLLYISRADIPGNHKSVTREGYRQVCIYSYTKETLHQFAEHGSRSTLEAIEDHELLRLLEMGLPVDVVELSNASISVDRQEDVELVVSKLQSQGYRP